MLRAWVDDRVKYGDAICLFPIVLDRNDLTAENAEDTEEEKREMNIFDVNGFDIS